MESKTRESTGPRRAKRAEHARPVKLVVPAVDGDHVDGVKQQRTDSFENLVLQHRMHLHREALRLTHDRTAAEDLVQDTLERAYRAFDRYHPEGKARAWFGCIMRNLWITECRRQQSAPHTVPLDGTDETTLDHGAVDADSSYDVEATLLDELGVASILGAINDVPSPYRQVVVLAVVCDVPYGTIAEMLALPVGTVASRLSRGRRWLQGVLRDQAPGIKALARAS
jgi:RNA polymerase sigma-70 factor, ECF subfamily